MEKIEKDISANLQRWTNAVKHLFSHSIKEQSSLRIHSTTVFFLSKIEIWVEEKKKKNLQRHLRAFHTVLKLRNDMKYMSRIIL